MDSPERPAVSSTTSTSTGFYSQKLWGFISPVLKPWAMWSGLGLGLRPPKVSLPIFIPHSWMWDHLFNQLPTRPPCHHHLATTATPPPHHILFSQLPISAPPTLLDEHCFFNSLVVGLPYSSIFWQFWVFFVLRLVVNLLMIVQGNKAYLPTPPSQLEVQKCIYTVEKSDHTLTDLWYLWFMKHINITHN